jgi:hypothetical protein
VVEVEEGVVMAEVVMGIVVIAEQGIVAITTPLILIQIQTPLDNVSEKLTTMAILQLVMATIAMIVATMELAYATKLILG